MADIVPNIIIRSAYCGGSCSWLQSTSRGSQHDFGKSTDVADAADGFAYIGADTMEVRLREAAMRMRDHQMSRSIDKDANGQI